MAILSDVVDIGEDVHTYVPTNEADLVLRRRYASKESTPPPPPKQEPRAYNNSSPASPASALHITCHTFRERKGMKMSGRRRKVVWQISAMSRPEIASL